MASNLNSEDQHPATRHHVEEEDHGFILVGRVRVKHPLGHDMTLWGDTTTVWKQLDLFAENNLLVYDRHSNYMQ